MQQLDRVHASDLTADGKLRRRFEIDEPEDKKTGVRFMAAFLIGNAFLILKSIFVPSDTSEAATAKSAVSDEASPSQDSTSQQKLAQLEATEEHEEKEADNVVNELELNFNAALSSGSAAIKFKQDNTISFTLPTVTPTWQPLDLGARAGQIGTNVVAFPTAATQPQPAAQATGGQSMPANDNGTDNRGSDDGDTDVDPAADAGGDDAPSGPVNRLPVLAGSVTLPSIFVNHSMLIGMLSLLQQAHDPDGDELQVSNLTASSGSITANGEGNWTYIPEDYAVGEVTFSYEVGDGEGHVQQTAKLDIVPIAGETIHGTDDDETIVGTPGQDRIIAKDGDDTILSREDDDFVDAGDGADRIVTGQGDDIVYAGAGDDVVYAGDGDDIVFGGDGDDIILGEGGNDSLFGEDGNDFLLAGAGDDRALGGTGDDLIKGEEGDDFLDGGAGADTLLAGSGDDVIIGGADDDTAQGDDGDDMFVATINDGDDSYDGGDGIDTVNYAGTTADATIDLSTGTASSDEVGVDQIVNVENVIGSAGDDVITGDAADNELSGAGGDDFIDGGDGIDTVSFTGSSTGVTIDLAAETASSDETGSDKIVNVENIIGSAGDDVITGNAADNELLGAEGDDTFIAAVDDGDDLFDGGDGIDTISFAETSAGAEIDLATGTAASAEIGDDQIANIENVIGSQGNDAIVLSNAINVVSGGGGDDSFIFEREHSSGHSRGWRDVIEDFDIGDRLDFSRFLGDQETDGWQRLTFIYDQAEFSGVGQIRYRFDNFDERDFTVVEVRVELESDDGEFDANFEIELTGRHLLHDENVLT